MDLEDAEWRLVLFFPPVHDFAMPHLSLPSLQGYVESNSNWVCESIDLNLAFFKWVFGRGFDAMLHSSKTSIDKNITTNPVESVLELHRKIDECLVSWSNQFPGYVLSSRMLKTPFDQKTSQGLSNAVASKDNVFTDTFRRLIKEKTLKDIDLFGVNLSVEDQLIPGLTLCKILRDDFPNSKIVVGGTLATRLQNGLFSKALRNLFDYLVVREGEEPLLSVLKALEKQTQAEDPRVLQSKPESVKQPMIVTNLDTLPSPEFQDINPHEYLSPYDIIPISLGRKCSWGKCDFCSIHTTWDPMVRFRPIEAVIRDIQFYLKRYDVSHYRIVDESPPIDRLREFSLALLESKLSIKYEAYCRLDARLLEENTSKTLSESGCAQLFFGLESFGSETLHLVNKGYSVSKIKNIFATMASEEIVNYVFVIMGIPGASIDDENLTINYLINDFNVHSVALASFVVDRNSPIHLRSSVAEKYGIRVFEEGDMTTEIGYARHGYDPRIDVKNRAKELTAELYRQRPDIALMSLLNEEFRFALACSFGNKFAQKFVGSCTRTEIDSIISRATERGVTERITRELKG